MNRYSDQREVIFASLDNEEPYYNAYEKDIAIAHFYFDSPTAFQFVKSVSFKRASAKRELQLSRTNFLHKKFVFDRTR